MRHPLHAARRERMQLRTPNEYRLRAQRERLHHVRPAPHTGKREPALEGSR
jgi:hypothetical protein